MEGCGEMQRTITTDEDAGPIISTLDGSSF